MNGEKNGKAKEYNNYGHLIFEGIYLNNKRLKGKEYDDHKNLVYDGEYLDGKRKGERKKK